jgi:hypothetical protein
MNKKPQKLAALEGRLRRLAQSLSRTGFVSEGSVFARKNKTSGSRYQSRFLGLLSQVILAVEAKIALDTKRLFCSDGLG